MSSYHRLGELPRKRHIVFRQPDGSLYHEHVMGSRGFSGPESLLYHRRPPTAIISSRLLQKCEWVRDDDATLRMRHFATHSLPQQKSVTLDRSAPALQRRRGDVVRAADDDRHVFLPQRARGRAGLRFRGDGRSRNDAGRPVVPGGRLRDHPSRDHASLEARRQTAADAGDRERRPDPAARRDTVNEVGQYLEHSPYCERDIRRPTTLQSHNETGEFPVVVKQNDVLTEVILDHHPFDVIGWDGYYYPWILSIHDFEPIVGSLHQPPPVHQTFQGDGFVVCSFVPRLFDFHPDAVPVPYNHSNVISDEVIYYANNEFMSRKGISAMAR